MVYIELLLSFLKIGVFSFGGGYAMIPLIQNEVINSRGWLLPSEFLDMLAIAQITPGPIAINTATFVGHRVGGIAGAFMATLAVVLPSFILVIVVSYIIKKMGDSKQVDYLYRGLRPVVLALIFSALFSIGRESIVDLPSALIALLCFLALRFKKINILTILVFSGLLGVFFY